MKSIIATIFTVSMAFFYFYGGYKLFTDNHYSTKQLVGGVILPPYAIYVGVTELFTEDSEFKKCMDFQATRTVEEILGNEKIKLLFEAGISKDEIVEIAVVQRDKDIEINCSGYKR